MILGFFVDFYGVYIDEDIEGVFVILELTFEFEVGFLLVGLEVLRSFDDFIGLRI